MRQIEIVILWEIVAESGNSKIENSCDTCESE